MDLVHLYYSKSYVTSCDHDCRQELLCKLKSTRSEDPHACDSMPRESFEFHCFNIA